MGKIGLNIARKNYDSSKDKVTMANQLFISFNTGHSEPVKKRRTCF
jgi:hypothetical protein